MTKVNFTETELMNMIEEATRETLKKILKEGATLDGFVQGVKGGFRGDYEKYGDNFGTKAKDYIKNGRGVNYDDFIDNSNEYDRSVKADKRASANLKDKKKNSESYPVSDIEKAHDDVRISKQNRLQAAGDMIGSRPGIIGKGQRAAAVGGVNVGRFGKKIKDKVTDFAHNTIGLKEE